MTKLIQLTLSKIKYTGDSIGDDIRIEADCLNHSVGVNKKVKNGSEMTLSIPIGNFFTDQLSFSLPLSIRVIERDLVFSDFGSIETVFKIDTRISTPQNFAAAIEVFETRNYMSKKKAVFELIFEAQVTDAIAYVSFTEQGWFTGKYTTTKKTVDLVSHLRVRFERSGVERDYFQILEGPERGQRASLAKKDGISHLEPENPHTGPVHLVYSLSQKTLTFGEQVYKTKEYPSDPDPWRKGFYDIRIADYSHDLGRRYLPRASLALVWFKLSHHDNKRYLHVGAVSEGCVTLAEVERWDALCKTLLKARRGDNTNIGTLEVVE